MKRDTEVKIGFGVAIIAILLGLALFMFDVVLFGNEYLGIAIWLILMLVYIVLVIDWKSKPK